MRRTVVPGLMLLALWGASEARASETSASIPESLVSCWGAEGNATDSVGANHGTARDGVTFADGRLGSSFDFAGGSPHVEFPDAPDLEPGTGFTFAAWLKPSDVSNNFVVAKQDGSSSFSYYLGIIGGRLQFDGGTTGGWDDHVVRTVDPVLQTGTWQHLAMVYDGSLDPIDRVRLYIDGVLKPVGGIGYPLPPPYLADVTAPTRLGMYRPGMPVPYAGRMDEVRFYGDPLAGADVEALASSEASCTDAAGGDADGRQGVWNLTEDFGRYPGQANPDPDSLGNEGVWSYMSTLEPHSPSSYRLLPHFESFDGGSQAWYASLGGPWTLVGLTAEGTIRVHPWIGEDIVIAWRSPSNQTVAVSGAVIDDDGGCGGGIAWWIDRGDAPLAHGSYGNGGEQSFASGAGGSNLASIEVQSGESLYFGVSTAGDDTCDSTKLDVEIATTSDRPVFSDHFEDGELNDAVWQEIVGGGPTAGETNGRLELNFPAGSSASTFYAGYLSRCWMRGDFDIQVDYELLTWPTPSNGIRVGLTTDLGAVERISDSGYGGESYLTDFGGVSGITPTTDLSGTLRQVRTGGTITGYFLRSGEWVALSSRSATGVDSRFATYAWGHGSLAGDVRIAFDDLVISEGELICDRRIGDRVWNDADADGEQDTGESGISGVHMELLDGSGAVVRSATTDADGGYSFSVSGGSHTIRVAANNFASDGALHRSMSTTGGLTQTRNADSGDVTSFDFGFVSDRDDDGVRDSADNCADHANADQRDDDGDGRGRACDPDGDDAPALPVTGSDPGFPETLHPYAAGAITIDPYPPVQGEAVELGALLQNPTDRDVVLTSVEFAVSDYGIGMAWGDVGSVADVALPAARTVDGEAVPGTAHPTISWTPPFSGHHCLRVTLRFSDGSTHVLQRNMDIVGFSSGGPRNVEFGVRNPAAFPSTITLKLIQVAQEPDGWTATLDPDTLTLDAGQVADVNLTIAPPHQAPAGSFATYHVEGYIGDTLIGGISKTVVVGGELPAPEMSWPSDGDIVPEAFTLTGRSLPRARIRCVLRDGTVFETVADGSGGWRLPIRLGGGGQMLRIMQGLGGSWSQPAGGGISVIAQGRPGVSGFSAPDISSGGTSRSNVLTFGGRGVPGFRVVVSWFDPHTGLRGTAGSATVRPDGTWMLESEELPDCHLRFTAVQVSRTGVEGDPSDEYVVLVDTAPPQITIEGVEHGGVYRKGVVPLIEVADLHADGSLDHSSGVDHSRTTITINGESFQSGTRVASPGSYELHVHAFDLAGNGRERMLRFEVTATIGDTVWYDADADGAQDAAEPGFPGVKVLLLGPSGSQLQAGTTDAAGRYAFEVLPGDYAIQIAGENFDAGAVLDGTRSTTEGEVVTRSVAARDDLTLDFGYTGTASLDDVIWYDGDRNGRWDRGEPGLPEVEVTLEVDLDGDDAPDYTQTVMSGGEGRFRFGNLPAKACKVKVRRATLPGGLRHRGSGGAAEEFDIAGFGLGRDEIRGDLGFAYEGTGSIGGRLWLEGDGNGLYDGDIGELGIPDVTVGVGVDFLPQHPGADYSTSVVTGPGGEYEFASLPACSCGVDVDETTLPPDLEESLDGDGDGTPGYTALDLPPGGHDGPVGFGYQPVTPPGTGTPGYWMNHPEAWPRPTLTVGGVTYSVDEAIGVLASPTKGDPSQILAQALIAAKLNVGIGNGSSCVAQTIRDADVWLRTYPIGSGVDARGATSPWRVGEPLASRLDDYNNGALCAPHRG